MNQEKPVTSIANSLVKLLLRSPLHKLADKNVALIIYTDRKTGDTHSEATNYVKEGKTLHIISQRERSWWHNLRDGATVKIILAGKQYSGWAVISEDQESVVTELRKIYSTGPQNAQLINIAIDKDGTLNESGLSAAAKDKVVVLITLS